jgi:hypothetical protein
MIRHQERLLEDFTLKHLRKVGHARPSSSELHIRRMRAIDEKRDVEIPNSKVPFHE